MKKRISGYHLAFQFILIVVIVGGLNFSPPSTAASQVADGGIYMVREIELAELGLADPAGIAYSPAADSLVILHGNPDQGGQNVSMISRYEHILGASTLERTVTNPLGMAFNPKANGLFVLDLTAQLLLQIPADQNGLLPSSASVSGEFDMNGLGIQQAQGLAFDPNDGRLFVLSPSGRQLIILTPDEDGNYEVGPAASDGRIARIDLKSLGEKHVRGLAYDPGKQLFYTIAPEGKTLYEFDATLEMIRGIDLSSLEIQDPQGMVIAPSGDNTDDPGIQNLYLADLGRNFIVEVSLTAPTVAALPPLRTDLSLVNTIQTSNWNPPSPDPVGIDYFPSINKLVITDSEVDEMSIYEGKNVFITNLGGSLSASCDTLAFSKEPTGVAINPNNNHLFISDDTKDQVFEIDLGGDGQYCTNDDSITSINTLSFNSTDPEGITFGDGSLFVSDGLSAEVFRLFPGSNGVFDGAPPSGDDTVSHFDTAGLNLRDPEGIGYNPQTGTLFLVSRPDSTMVETSLNGNPLNVFDISFLNARAPSGVGAAPSSQNAAVYSLYMSARGVDNNNDPNENDGKVYEIRIGSVAPTVTPTATSTPPPGAKPLFLSFANSGTYTIGGVAGVRDEDILYFDGAQFSMAFDGSDVSVGGVDLDAFYRVDQDTFLLSFHASVSVPNVGPVDEWDVIQFDATSLGTNTAGTYSLYFDGNQVGLDTTAEDIDALDVLPDGRILLSITGNSTISGIAARDEDLLAFTPTSLGATTDGNWAMYFDGSDVDLATSSGEDVDGTSVDANGTIYLSTLSSFAVSGVSGTNADLFACAPTSTGDTTACTYNSSLYFQAASWGITGNNLDAFDIP